MLPSFVTQQSTNTTHTTSSRHTESSSAVRIFLVHIIVALLCIPVLVVLCWIIKNLAIHLYLNFSSMLFGLLLPAGACVLAVCVVILSNPMHALLSLVGVFLSAVMFYVSSGIEFIGLVFLIVYVGAVAILFLFVIMLLNVKSLTTNEPILNYLTQTISLVFGVLLACHLYVTVADRAGRMTLQSTLLNSQVGVEQLYIDDAIYYQVMYRAADVNGIAPLYTEHAPLFWITTINLLLALLGGIILATSTTEQTTKMVSDVNNPAAMLTSSSSQLILKYFNWHTCVLLEVYCAELMPQVDKATFFPIVLWTFILYVGGFLFLNSSTLFTFLSSLKLAGKRGARKYTEALTGRRLLSGLMLFPWISL